MDVIPSTVLANIANLQSISLDNTQLTQISDNVFADLTNLQFISLGDNKLTEIPSNVFADLTNLKKLWLNYNPIPIEQIEELRYQLPNVEIFF